MTNTFNKPIKYLRFFGYTRDSETGKALGLYGRRGGDITLEPMLKPGETRELLVHDGLTPYFITRNMIKGRLQVTLSPEYIRYSDLS